MTETLKIELIFKAKRRLKHIKDWAIGIFKLYKSVVEEDQSWLQEKDKTNSNFKTLFFLVKIMLSKQLLRGFYSLPHITVIKRGFYKIINLLLNCVWRFQWMYVHGLSLDTTKMSTSMRLPLALEYLLR